MLVEPQLVADGRDVLEMLGSSCLPILGQIEVWPRTSNARNREALGITMGTNNAVRATGALDHCEVTPHPGCDHELAISVLWGAISADTRGG